MYKNRIFENVKKTFEIKFCQFYDNSMTFDFL